MKITKMPFQNHSYLISHEAKTEEIKELENWLNTTGQRKYRVSGHMILDITDPVIETMFVLRWGIK